jgi:DNA-binding transcriptional LysR family regulator
VPPPVAALHVVARTDLVAAVPAQVCRDDLDALRIATRTRPLALPGVRVLLRWYQRSDVNPAHAWFRTLVTRCWPVQG